MEEENIKAKKTCPVKNPFARLAICLVAGILIGWGATTFMNSRSNRPLGTATVAEADLDKTCASFTKDGKSTDVTIRQVLTTSGNLETSKDSEGNYNVPAADMIMGYVRNKVMLDIAAKKNITVSDDEALDFLKKNMGAQSYDDLAKNAQVDVETVKGLVRESATIQKLYDDVAGLSDGATEPAQPTQPAEGKKDEATTEYFDYIVGLAKDEWDANAGTWARQDGPYYQALSSEDFSDGKATYAQAQTAYYIAVQDFSAKQAKSGQAWADFVRSELSNVSITINTLAS